VSRVSPVDVIRDQFPALHREHRGHPVATSDDEVERAIAAIAEVANQP
jgi:hypothetical protein